MTTKKKRSYWLCKCDCGNDIVVSIGHLRNGHTKSCGCLKKVKRIQKNDYEVQEDYVIMYTNKNEMFLVDLDDFKKVRDIHWYKNSNEYIVGCYNNKRVFIHRFVTNYSGSENIDHINGQKNDNRKINLRIATKAENSRNKKICNKLGVKGVSQRKNGKFMSKITYNRNQYYLGTFDTLKEASDAYDKKAIELFGGFARLNNYK